MRRQVAAPYTLLVLPAAVVVVSDAHLGFAPRDDADTFHRFLDAVPRLASHLVLNGDLFEFWFEYRHVIPSAAFRTLERLAAVRRAGVRLTVTGGNHDRWGGPFWRRELKAEFHPKAVELDLAGYTALVAHGDAVGDTQWSSRALHALTRHRLAVQLFGLVHPDLGWRLVHAMSPHLSGKSTSEDERRRAAERQERYALDLLARRPDVELVVMGHTHVPRLVRVGERRWYLNSGAWCEGHRYARVTPGGPVLDQFAG